MPIDTFIAYVGVYPSVEACRPPTGGGALEARDLKTDTQEIEKDARSAAG